MAGKVIQIAELRVKGDKANQVLRELDKTARSLNQTAKRTEKNMKSLSSGMNTLKGVLGSAGVLGALYALQAGFRATFDEMRTFGKGIAEINTLLDDNQKITEKTRSTFLDFSAQYGQSAQSQVKGFYDIVSAGVSDTQQALGVLEVANKAAVAGVTDVATTADVLTSSMNAYASAGLSAAKASDILFATVRAGKTTMPELASNVGKVAPIAASAGLKFSEMAGALAQLTKVGLSTDEAATGLKALLTGVIKPAPQAIEMAKKLGIQFDTAAIRSKGLAGFIAEITEKTGGNEKALAKLFPNVRALSGVLSLASGGADAFAKTLKDVADAGGATETAFEKVKKSLDFKLNQLNAEFSKLGIILHTKLLPVYEAVIKGFKWLIDNATAIAGAIGVVAGAIALLNAKFIALKLLVLTNPIGLLVAGLATAAFLVIKNWDKIKLFLEKLFTIWIPNWIDKAKIKFIELQQKGFGGKILKNLAGLWEKFFNFLIAGYNNSIGKITGKKIPPIKLTFEGDEAKSKIDEINKRIEARLLKEKQINDELKKRLDIPQPSAPTGAGPTGPADPGSVGGEIEKTTDSLKSFKEIWGDTKDAVKEGFKGFEGGIKSFSSIAKDAFNGVSDALTDLVTTGKADFKSLAQSILKSLTKVLLKMAIVRAVKATIGLFAQGGVFQGGQVTAFAKGGVVDSPTIFPMKKGMGLMGEAGPEAVMPLKRTSGGDLGVKAEGMGGSNVTVNVINQSGSETEQRERKGPGGEKIIDVIIKKAVNDGFSNGSFDRSLQGSFGLSRRGVA